MSPNIVLSKMKKMVLLASLGLIFTSLTSPLTNGMMSIPLKKRPINTNLYPNRSPGTLRNLDDVARKTGGKIIKSSKRSEGISLKIAGIDVLDLFPSFVSDFVESLFVRDNLSLAVLLRNSDDMFYIGDVFVGSN
jgi:hypothetical protein